MSRNTFKSIKIYIYIYIYSLIDAKPYKYLRGAFNLARPPSRREQLLVVLRGPAPKKQKKKRIKNPKRGTGDVEHAYRMLFDVMSNNLPDLCITECTWHRRYTKQCRLGHMDSQPGLIFEF